MVMQAAAGMRLAGRYRLDKQLGKGGMGTVWQAHDQVLERTVAVKFVNLQGLGHQGAESRLQREAKLLGSMTHPHVAHVHDLCDTAEGTFIVMELIHGESLADRLAGQSRLPPAQAAGIAAQCAQALGAAHEAGIVHRDIKPSNIMLTGDTVKLIDFGIAGSLNPIDTTAVGMMGTAAYLAPERVTGASATPATDLYALGVVLYEMLAGHRPFQAEESIALLYAHATADPLPLPATIPAALAETCLSLLAKDPAARPGSRAVADSLLLSAASPQPSTYPHPAPPASTPDRTIFGDRSPRSPANTPVRRAHGILLPAGALSCAAVVACAVWLITTNGTSSAVAQPRQTHSPTTTAPAPATTPPILANTSAHLAQPTGPGAVSVPPPAISATVAPHPGNPNPGKGNPHPGKNTPPGQSKPKPAHP